MIETARWSDNRLRNRPINPKEKARIAFAMRAFEFGGESGSFFQYQKTPFFINTLPQKAGLFKKKTDTRSVSRSPPMNNDL
ncbi:hypothetical protein ACN262_32865 [Burkholderia gladioli]|uniref:hypothetical protein n=1 Tax=Burkholderia gladioli TaxID=28095 RepID=UPI003AFB428B